MPLKAVDAYLKAHDLNGDGLLAPSEVDSCLQEVLQDLGASEHEGRTIAKSLLEESMLRSDASPVGAGMLGRMVQAAQAQCAQRGVKRGAETQDVETESFATAKELSLQAEAASWGAPSRGAVIPLASKGFPKRYAALTLVPP